MNLKTILDDYFITYNRKPKVSYSLSELKSAQAYLMMLYLNREFAKWQQSYIFLADKLGVNIGEFQQYVMKNPSTQAYLLTRDGVQGGGFSQALETAFNEFIRKPLGGITGAIGGVIGDTLKNLGKGLIPVIVGIFIIIAIVYFAKKAQSK